MKTTIIGSGIAGLSTAILCEERGDEVTIISKSADIFECNTAWAQGGIVYQSLQDKLKDQETLKKDILKASDYSAKEETVNYLINNSSKVVQKFLMEKIKVPFEKEKDEKQNYLLTKEGGHSKRRIVFSGDQTGKVIMESLVQYIKTKTKIKILIDHFVVDLITIPHHCKNSTSIYNDISCVGMYVMHKQKVKKIFTDKIVIATGGIGEVYKYHTNPSSATGDGIAFGYRAGLRVINMEYTQFHPTTLGIRSANNFLISEAVRGEGAELINEKKKYFMRNIKASSLASRDIVAREIFKQQILYGEHSVYLCLKKMTKENFPKRFPNIYRQFLKYKLDIEKDLISIVPAFHFSCGGILTDLEGRTNFDNVFAVGESSCTGLHGANRLASTSLLEGVVFAHAVAKAKVVPKNIDTKIISNWNSGKEKVDLSQLKQSREIIKNIMWNSVGIIRKKKNLIQALFDLKNIQNKLEKKYHNSQLSVLLLEVRNLVQVAILITDSCLKNKVSKGCHFILDE